MFKVGDRVRIKGWSHTYNGLIGTITNLPNYNNNYPYYKIKLDNNGAIVGFSSEYLETVYKFKLDDKVAYNINPSLYIGQVNNQFDDNVVEVQTSDGYLYIKNTSLVLFKDGSFEDKVKQECERALKLHGPFNSLHEAYAVILEEVEEFWDEVKKKSSERDNENMKTELIQIAAMCKKAIEFINTKEK